MEEPGKKFRAFIDTLATTLAAKNADYGDSAFTPPPFAPNVSPEESVWVRLGDKVSRLETLLKRDYTPRVAESVDDTILDLAGYCAILWTMRHEDEHEL